MILFVLVLLQSGGMMLCFSVQQEMIREEMMEELKREEKELETIVLKAEDFLKCRVEEHELRYLGRMYDIRSVVRNGDLMVIRALRDHKEESLLGALKKLIHHSRDRGGRVNAGVLLLSFISYLKPESLLPFPAENNAYVITSSALSNHYGSIVEEVTGPPPEHHFCI